MAAKLMSWLALALCVLIATGAAPASAADGSPVGTVQYQVVNVRSGPGTTYAILTTATRGATFPVTGRNPAGDWAQVCCVRGSPAWIYRPLLAIDGEFSSVPIVQATGAPAPAPTPAPVSGWRGEYFDNPSLAGAPVLTRDDPVLSFRWGGASPGPNVPAVDFSARWSRALDWEGGDTTFWAQADDGVRVYLDGRLVIDAWREGSAATFTNTFRDLAQGSHIVTVEYLQARGDSVVAVWWEVAGRTPAWRGEYFDDIHLEGPPLVVRGDPAIDFNWGLGSPDPSVPEDNWSVRWTRPAWFTSGSYEFFARTDDGVRIYLDGWLVLDKWGDAPGTYETHSARFYHVEDGWHVVTVEYYARGGIAYAMVWWEPVGGIAPQ